MQARDSESGVPGEAGISAAADEEEDQAGCRSVQKSETGDECKTNVAC